MTQRADEKAAFVTPGEHYQPKVLMMGLCNVPSKFQELKIRVKELSGEKVTLAYLTDVITAGDRYNEHLEQIEKILMAMKQAGLTIRLKKRKFFMSKVQFRGFRLSKEGILPDSKKVTAIAEFPPPEDVYEVSGFIGLTSFFRRFVKNYAAIANPLTSLQKRDAVFEWTANCQKAFELLKERLRWFHTYSVEVRRKQQDRTAH